MIAFDCGLYVVIQCQAVVALVGPTVFHGRIYKTVHSMDFRLEFIVSGSDIMQVIMLCTNNYADNAMTFL